MSKYSLLRDRAERELQGPSCELRVPLPASDEQLLLAHTSQYLHKVKNGRLQRKEIRRIGFPWSEGMVERSRRSVGATIAAARSALVDGVGVNLAGGTHHAFADAGEGYCVFNDSIVAARVLQQVKAINNVLVVDTDVHQGNGTAAIARDDSSIYTLSIHGARNFPLRKEQSDLDLPLEDGARDDQFLGELERGLTIAFDDRQYDLLIYLAGADPFAGDSLGKLSVSKAGLAERDRLVFAFAKQHNVPVAMTMAGGYAREVQDTVDIHFASVQAALEFCLNSTSTTSSTIVST